MLRSREGGEVALAGVGPLTVRLGHHELLIRLAAGGAANVFLVRDTSVPPPGRLLALKILLPSLAANEDFLNMFFTEARIAARLEHPNIVAIAGFGQVEGIHCLAMEYVFGSSLAQVLRASAKAKKPLTVGVLLRITAQVCDALHYAHELHDEAGEPMGIVHRDVTPQNILIGFNGVPKLTDFGIAKATNRGWETQAGIVKGKFSYMSPEQALGKRVDRRSDIFGAGIVLWEALTGRDLFRGSTPLEVLTAIREQKIEPPSKVVPGLTPIVDPIVMKALKRQPKQRFQTALEMRQEIENLIARAGVTIDANTISREFASIYGNEIVDRAFALRTAMAGKADPDQLAQVLGGAKLSAKHLPVIPGGISHPDPLGLFADPLAHRDTEAPSGKNGAVPARVEASFKANPNKTETLEDVEILDSDDAQQAAKDFAEINRLEAEGSRQEPVVDDELLPKGWDDSSAQSIPRDELLSMLSEDDATIGYLPQAFAERFGRELKAALAEGESPPPEPDAFEDELTVGVPSAAQVAQVRKLQRDLRPSSSRAEVGGGILRRREGEDPPPARSPRPVPRAPSLDLDARPFPRAPSLDMDSDEASVTPAPEVVISGGAPPHPAMAAPAPLGERNFSFRGSETPSPKISSASDRRVDTFERAPVVTADVLESTEDNPLAGGRVPDHTFPRYKMQMALPDGTADIPEDAGQQGRSSTSDLASPEFPDVLSAFDDAVRPANTLSPGAREPLSPAFDDPTPPPRTRQKGGRSTTSSVLVAVVLTLMVLGVLLGVLFLRS